MKSRPQPRRALLSLAWGAGLFLMLQLAANAWLPARIKPWSDPSYFLRRDRLAQRIETRRQDGAGRGSSPPQRSGLQPYVVAMLGSSRTMNGFDARRVEAELQTQLDRPVLVANFGAPGASPIHDMVYLGRLLRDGPRPDLLLIEVLPAQLSSSAAVLGGCITALDEADRAWLQRWNLPVPKESGPRDLPSGIACWDHRTELIRAVFPRLLPGQDNATWAMACDEYGMIPQRHKAVSAAHHQAALQVARRDFYEIIQEFRLGGPGLAGLDAMLQACQEQGVAAVLVVMPEGPELRSWYRQHASQEILAALDDLARRRRSRVLNGWAWMPEPASIRRSPPDRDAQRLVVPCGRAPAGKARPASPIYRRTTGDWNA